jgi:acetylornithine deacetylase/succinyl-diaminopimelate desuccinylase
VKVKEREERMSERLFAAIGTDEAMELTARLIRIPSHWEVPEKEVEVVRAIVAFLEAERIPYELQKVEGERYNVIARIPGAGSGRSLALVGHLDTVPPFDMTVPPFDGLRQGNRLYGRGAVDMKGPVATMLLTLAAFARTGIVPEGDLCFAGVLAEETNSDGCETLVASGFRTDGAIVGEPSAGEYSIGHRGLEWIEVEFFGKRAHGAIPEAGVNAIVHAAAFVQRVQERIVPALRRRTHPAMGQSVMNFGTISGGTQPSTVADRCLIRLDRRYLPDESVESVLAEYQEILDELAREDPTFKAELRRMPENLMRIYDHVSLETSPEDPLVTTLLSVLEDVRGMPPSLSTRRGWTDAALLSRYGRIPTVVYGPGNISRSHTAEEYITAEELEEGLRAYLLLALRYCGAR